MAQDIDTILANACLNRFLCLSPAQQRAVLLQILCNFSGGGGTGTGATFGNYGGGTPTPPPASGSGLAVDTSNHTFWEYDNGVWHNLV
jgi:hypothetical protein